MALVGTIVANLTAGTAAFEAGIGKAKGILGGFASDWKNLGDIAIGTQIGSFIGNMVSDFQSAVKATFELADAHAKLADRLGVSMQALQGLQHAGDLAGVSADEMERNLQKLSKQLGDAMRGEGDLAKALDRMGLSAGELIAMPLDQAMQKIANGIAAINDPALRASLAVDLFGKSGQKMLNMLAEGGDGLTKARAEIEAMGAMSRRQSKAIETMNDEWTRVSAMSKQAAGQVAAMAAPFIEFGATAILALTGVTSKSKELEEQLKKTSAEAKVLGVSNPPISLKRGPGGGFIDPKDFEAGKKVMEDIADPYDKLMQKQDELERLLGRGAITVDTFQKAWRKAEEEFSKTDPIDQMIASIEAQTRALEDNGKAAQLAAAARKGATNEELQQLDFMIDQLEMRKRIKAENEKLGQFAEQQKEALKTPGQVFEDTVTRLRDAFSRGLIDQDQLTAALGNAAKTLEGTSIDIGGPAAKTRGSQDAFAAIDQFNRRNEQNRDVRQLVQNARDQTQIQRRLAQDIGRQVAAQFGIQGI